MSERWKPVVGFENLYEVSSEGNVRAIAKTVYVGSKKRELQQKTLCPYYRNKTKYVSLYRAPKLFPRAVHRLVYEAFVGDLPSAKRIKLIDGDYKNCSIDNLAVCPRNKYQVCAVCRNCSRQNKLSEGQQKRNNPILLLNADLSVYKAYRSASDAAEELGVTREAVSICCREGNRCFTVCGYFVVKGTLADYELGKVDMNRPYSYINRKFKSARCYDTEGNLAKKYSTVREAK